MIEITEEEAQCFFTLACRASSDVDAILKLIGPDGLSFGDKIDPAPFLKEKEFLLDVIMKLSPVMVKKD